MYRLNSSQKIFFSYGSLLLGFLALLILGRASLMSLLRADAQDDRSYEILLRIHDVKVDFTEAALAASQTQAALGDENSTKILSRLDRHVNQLKQLTEGDELQSERLQQVLKLKSDWQKSLASGQKSSKPLADPRLVQVHTELERMHDVEEKRLTFHEKETAQYTHQTIQTLLGGSMFGFGLALVLTIISARGLRRQQLARIELENQAQERAKAEELQRQMAAGLHKVMTMADELLQEQDFETFLRRAVELPRERLNIERCGLFLYDESKEFLLGTFGTDMEGKTSDERQLRVLDRQVEPTQTIDQPSWLVHEEPLRWKKFERDQLQFETEDESGSPLTLKWVVSTPIQSSKGLLGVLYNDTALTNTPIDPIQQELLAVYCSMLGNMYESKAKAVELTKAEEMYRGLVENAFQGIFRCTAEGEFIMANAALVNLYGYESSDELAAVFADNPARVFVDLRRPQKLLRIVAEQGSVIDLEMPIRHKNGRTIWVSKSARAVCDPEGKLLYVEGTVRNITDRKEAEEKLNARLHNEAELAACSQDLLSAPDIEEGINAALEHLLAATHASRVYIFENFTDESGNLCVRQNYEAHQPEVPTLMGNPEFTEYCYETQLTRWREMFEKGSAITGLTRHFPWHEREILEARGARSLVCLPLYGSRGWKGFIGFCDVTADHEWNEDDIRFMRTAADLIVAFQERKEAENALRISEEQSRTLLRSLPQLVFFKDTQHRFVSVNEHFARAYNTSPENIIGKTDFDFQPAELAGQFQRDDRRMMESRQSDCIEEQWLDDGEIRYIETIKSPVIADNGEVLGVLGLITDITERKQYELALKQAKEELEQRVAERTAELEKINDSLKHEVEEHQAAEEELRRVLDENLRLVVAIENLPLGVVMTAVHDPGDPTIFVNPAFTKITGYNKSEILGKGVRILEGPLTDRGASQRITQAIQNGQPHEETLINYRKDGTTYWNELRLSPVFNEKGELISYIGLQNDVTDRVETELALAASEERYRSVVANVNEVIYQMDAGGWWTFLNPAWTSITGLDVEESLNSSFLEQLVPEDYDRAVQLLKDLQAQKREYGRIELRFRHKNEEFRWVDAFIRPILDEAGQVKEFVGTLMDITDRKLAEEQLRHAKQEAESANMAKSEFLSRMSHELRTPLNAILGFGQILEQQDLGPTHMKRIRHILSGGRHLLGLIDEILDLSRIECGRLQLSMEPVFLTEVVREAVDLIHPIAAEFGVQLNIDAEDVPFYVTADRQRLKQVLLNLLGNAVKYNNRGGSVTLTLQTFTSCPRGLTPGDDPSLGAIEPASVRLGIRDTGRGIPADKLSRLFTPFERVGAEFTSIQGTGLGLAVSKRLIEAMEGAMGVESVLGQGSTFWFELPQDKDPEFDIPHPVEDDSVATKTGLSGTVLYIEDNLSNMTLMEHILGEYADVKMITAMQGELGLDLARKHLPDLVLLDLHIPDLMGWEVLKRLREGEGTHHIPVVVVSADATPHQIERLKKIGADAYLTKPIDVTKLMELLHRHLGCEGEPQVTF